MIQLLVVDDHELILDSLTNILQTQPDFGVVGQARSVQEAITQASMLSPDVIIMDYVLADGTGVEATKAILVEQPAIKIIFLTVYGDTQMAIEALKAGAKSFLQKSVHIRELVETIRKVFESSDIFFPAPVQPEKGVINTEKELSLLSYREKLVLRYLASGYTNLQIANEMFIGLPTVKKHIRAILGKLELNSRFELALYARQSGLMEYYED